MSKFKKLSKNMTTLWNSFLYLAYCGCSLMLSLTSIKLVFEITSVISSNYDKEAMQAVFSTLYTSYIKVLLDSEWTVDFFISIINGFLAVNSTYIMLIIVFIIVLFTPIKEGAAEISIKKGWFYVTVFALIISFFNLNKMSPIQINYNELEPLVKSLEDFKRNLNVLKDAGISEEECVTFYIFCARKIGLLFCLLVTYIFVLCSYSKQIVCTKIEILLYISLEYFLLKAFSTLSLLEFYVYFEAVLIPMYLLIIGWGSGEAKKGLAAYYLVFYTIFFSVPLLVAILYLGDMAQSFNIFAIKNLKLSWDVEFWVMLALFLGFAVKIPIFPFHTWLPEAHVNASTTASVILASLLLKLGGYGMLEFLIIICPSTCKYYLPIIYTLLIISIIYSSMVAIVQTDLKRIIAYSSIAHMNLSIIGVFCSNVEAIIGSVYQMISHGIISAGLFFLIGFIYDRYRTRDISYYGGLTMTMPLFSVFFFVFTLANIGFPGTSSFVGELLLFLGIYKQNTVIAVLALSSSFLSPVYSVWTYNRVCFGTLSTNYLGNFFFDLNRQEFVIMVYLLIPLIVLGVCPNILIDYLSFTKYFFFKHD
jgi:NADH-quinone oxidoreductase subunit M